MNGSGPLLNSLSTKLGEDQYYVLRTTHHALRITHYVLEGRTRFSRLRGGYELITKKRNQLQPGYGEVGIVCRGGYDLVTPSVTAVTLFLR
jgi:hypothetical protein